jgi:ankyrin repeat protein
MSMIRHRKPVEEIRAFVSRHPKALEWIRDSHEPLHWAIVLYSEAVPLLIELGADIEAKSETGMTVLMRACAHWRK